MNLSQSASYLKQFDESTSSEIHLPNLSTFHNRSYVFRDLFGRKHIWNSRYHLNLHLSQIYIISLKLSKLPFYHSSMSLYKDYGLDFDCCIISARLIVSYQTFGNVYHLNNLMLDLCKSFIK